VQVSTYSSDGFAVLLPPNRTHAQLLLNKMQAKGCAGCAQFLDVQTRALVIDFSMYSFIRT
jgi:hypothetical protein